MASNPYINGLSAFRAVIRAQKNLFNGDRFAQTEAVKEIRSHFESNRHVTDSVQLQKLYGNAEEAVRFLTQNVVQGRLNAKGRYEVAIKKEHVEGGGRVLEVPQI